MTQTQTNYLLKCVIPSLIDVEVLDEGLYTNITYMDHNGIQHITVTMAEYINCCSRADEDGWAKAMIDRAMTAYTENQINSQYDI